MTETGYSTVTRTYGTQTGFNVCYRYWQDGEMPQVTGHKLSFEMTFAPLGGAQNIPPEQVGNLHYLLCALEAAFGERWLVAEDDPFKDEICALEGLGVARVLVVQAVTLHEFAKMAYNYATDALNQLGIGPLVCVLTVACREDGTSAVTYYGEKNG